MGLFSWIAKLFKNAPRLEKNYPVKEEIQPDPEGRLTKNFHIDEFACNDGTPVPDELHGNVSELAQNLQVLRDALKKPIRVISGYRHPEYNRRIGGAKKSRHMTAEAADIRVKDITSKIVADKIDELIAAGKMKKGGLGRYSTFTHYDIRGSNARWNDTQKKS